MPEVTRRTFLQLTTAGMVALTLDPLESALAAPPEIPPTIIGHDLHICAIQFTAPVDGTYELRRRAEGLWDGSGDALLAVFVAAGASFMWVAAPGGEIVARQGVVLTGPAPITEWIVQGTERRGGRLITMRNNWPVPVSYDHR